MSATQKSKLACLLVSYMLLLLFNAKGIRARYHKLCLAVAAPLIACA